MSFFDPDLLSRLEGLRLVPRRAQQSSVSGGLVTPVFKGASMEFVDYKSYAPGDDPRRIDWKVYGRRDRYYLRSYEGETNYTLWLALDASRSMKFQGPAAACDKWSYACRAALGLAYITLRSHNACGLALFSGGLTALMEAGTSLQNFSRAVHTLDSFDDFGPTTNYAKSFSVLAEHLPRPALVVVFSDFLGAGPDETATALEALSLGRHEILAFQILDAFEEDLEAQGAARILPLEAEETPPLEIQWTQIAQDYREAFREESRQFQARLSHRSIDHQIFRTNNDLANTLAYYLSQRLSRA